MTGCVLAPLTFVVPGAPVGKERPRLGKGHVYTPTKTTSYEHKVKVFALQAIRKHGSWIVGTKLPLTLTLRVYFENNRRRDLDNVAKCVDGLNGLVWHDDSQVHELHVYRHVDQKNPRVEVAVDILDDR